MMKVPCYPTIPMIPTDKPVLKSSMKAEPKYVSKSSMKSEPKYKSSVKTNSKSLNVKSTVKTTKKKLKNSIDLIE